MCCQVLRLNIDSVHEVAVGSVQIVELFVKLTDKALPQSDVAYITTKYKNRSAVDNASDPGGVKETFQYSVALL